AWPFPYGARCVSVDIGGQSLAATRRAMCEQYCAVPVAGATSTYAAPPIPRQIGCGGAPPGSVQSLRASARGSTGIDWPGNPPRSGVLSAGGVLPVAGWGPAPPPSRKEARGGRRAPATHEPDRQR